MRKTCGPCRGRPAMLQAVAAGLVVVLGVTCGGRPDNDQSRDVSAEDTVSVVLDADALMTEWRELAKTPKENLSNPRCQLIGRSLAFLGPEALDPLFSLLEDREADPVKKVLVVATLASALSPDMVPRLGPLTDANQESTTRACAMELLSMLRSPHAEPYFRAHQSDPEKRVRLTAIVGLAALGDTDARRRIVQWYSDSDTTVSERERILREIATAPTSEDNAILAIGLAEKAYSVSVRILCAQALSRVGDASVLEGVRTCAQEDPVEALRQAAQDAAVAIEARQAVP